MNPSSTAAVNVRPYVGTPVPPIARRSVAGQIGLAVGVGVLGLLAAKVVIFLTGSYAGGIPTEYDVHQMHSGQFVLIVLALFLAVPFVATAFQARADALWYTSLGLLAASPVVLELMTHLSATQWPQFLLFTF